MRVASSYKCPSMLYCNIYYHYNMFYRTGPLREAILLRKLNIDPSVRFPSFLIAVVVVVAAAVVVVVVHDD
jgi:hypothetical protein